MANPATTTTPGEDVEQRLARLDRVVAQLRALEPSRDGDGARGGELSDAVRAWSREAKTTRRRLTGSTRLPLTPTSKEALR